MKNKKLIILGASGFIGKNLVQYFKKKQYDITGTYYSNKIHVKGVKHMKCDLTKKDQVDKVIKGADIVIQAAASTSGAKDIINKPYLHVNDNAIINSMVTRACYHNNVKHIIMFSCTVMYSSSNKAQKESDFNANKEIYSRYFGGAWTKIFIEKMSEFYSRLNRNKYTIIRHSNVFGPNDKFDLEKSHVFAATINKVVNCKNNTVTVWGSGKESRDLIYIDDLMRFVSLAIKNQKKIFEIYNVGSGRLVSINGLVKKVVNFYNKKIIIKNDLSKISLTTKVYLDCKKAKKEIKWVPKVSLESGIKKTLKWYLANK
jgi:nucleoside-diphosphate-sugar epimerase|tara:strand:+ start:571 stop:1515 length:945 start_codon:yes stop_codon:yes gene_type:complete